MNYIKIGVKNMKDRVFKRISASKNEKTMLKDVSTLSPVRKCHPWGFRDVWQKSFVFVLWSQALLVCQQNRLFPVALVCRSISQCTRFFFSLKLILIIKCHPWDLTTIFEVWKSEHARQLNQLVAILTFWGDKGVPFERKCVIGCLLRASFWQWTLEELHSAIVRHVLMSDTATLTWNILIMIMFSATS